MSIQTKNDMVMSVIGLGKLGAPWLAVLAAAGYKVIGVDKQEAVVGQINLGIAPVYEPGLQNLLKECEGRYWATTSIETAVKQSIATFVIVPTPSRYDGAFSMDIVADVAREIGAALRDKQAYHLVVIVSTIMPVLMSVVENALEAGSGKPHGDAYGLCYNPEFVALGDVIRGMQEPDLILIGESNARAGGALETFYKPITLMHPTRIFRTDFTTAALAKLLLNSYVTMKITFANQVGEFCKAYGADAGKVVDVLGADRRIGRAYLTPGTAYGGPCFPRDNAALRTAAMWMGMEWPLGELVHELNAEQLEALGQEIIRTVAGDRIRVGFLGLAYKMGTGVLDESASVTVIEQVTDYGIEVVAYDPLVMKCIHVLEPSDHPLHRERVRWASSAVECVAQSTIIVLMHPDLSLLDGVDLTGKTLIDPWGVMAGREQPVAEAVC